MSRSSSGSRGPDIASAATGEAAAKERLGVRPRLRRRRNPARLRRGAPRREGPDSRWLPPSSGRALRRQGIRVRKVMTDNGPAYISLLHKLACTALAIKHSRTRPYRPRTNGKAERFIRTMLGGWAYGAIYGNTQERQRPPRLARLLQSPTTPRQPQPPATPDPPTRDQEQRLLGLTPRRVRDWKLSRSGQPFADAPCMLGQNRGWARDALARWRTLPYGHLRRRGHSARVRGSAPRSPT